MSGTLAAPMPFVNDMGNGKTLVFLHAFPLEASMWDRQVEHLGGRFRCMRPDFYGCGSSPAPSGEVSIDDYAAGVMRALDSRRITDFGVVGLSMGGYEAFALLRLAAARITSLVLAATRADAEPEATAADRIRMAEEVLHAGVDSIIDFSTARLLSASAQARPDVVGPVRQRIRRCTPAGYAAAQRAIATRPDSTEQLPAITVPTLVIGGADDEAATPALMVAMAAAIPGARRVSIEDCGHLVNLEQPERFNAELDAFYSTVG